MYTYISFMTDLPLMAIGVAIWIVAMGVAFGFYLPVLRAQRHAAAIAAAQSADPVWTGEDLDHAAMPPTSSAIAVAAPLAVSEPIYEPPVVPAPVAEPEPLLEAAADWARPEAFSVLIVDDNAINRQVLELILDSVGIAHASVENGLEAVEAMAVCAHDAILMDLQMPVMDGFEATRRIRALEAQRGGSPARIIVVSANCLDEHVTASRQAGADSHLAKPISAGALIGEVEDCATISRLAA
jgi:CheY-like chemotaxis protein